MTAPGVRPYLLRGIRGACTAAPFRRPSVENRNKLSEAALAILGLTAFRNRQIIRAWKGMDWDLLEASVVFTDEGAKLAEEFLTRQLSQ